MLDLGSIESIRMKDGSQGAASGKCELLLDVLGCSPLDVK